MKKTLAYPAEYGIVRLVETSAHLLPRSLTLALGASAGTLLYRSGVYRKIVMANMNHVGFPAEPSREEIIRKLYRNVGRYFADFIRPSQSPPPHSIENYERVDSLFGEGKGILVLLGHFGNWEILATIFGRSIDKLNVIAKPMKNTMVQEWLDRKRASTGVQTIYTRQALRKSLGVLRSNGMLAVLIDQYAGTEGSPAPFLGKEASTIRAVAYLTHKTGCGVLPTWALMQEDRTYRVMLQTLQPPVTRGMTTEEAVAAYQKQHNDILSEWIREYPEHWFGWFHKRFRKYARY